MKKEYLKPTVNFYVFRCRSMVAQSALSKGRIECGGSNSSGPDSYDWDSNEDSGSGYSGFPMCAE